MARKEYIDKMGRI